MPKFDVKLQFDVKVVTSSCLNNCFAVGADTRMRRAVGEMKPSSTALSTKDNKELQKPSTFKRPTWNKKIEEGTNNFKYNNNITSPKIL